MTLLLPLFFLIAILFAAVGHAGASGYLAVMALYDVPPEVMRPAALIMNIVVASIAAIRYLRAGLFNARLFWPLALCAVPLAFLGGLITLPASGYRPLVALVLLWAAIQLWRHPADPPVATMRTPSLPLLLGAGGVLGLLSGLTGVGGGIFLSPLLLLGRWSPTREVSGVVVLFVLCNSLAGLAGVLASGTPLPSQAAWWALAAAAGGLLGAELGARRLGVPIIRRLLVLVLLVAAFKMSGL